MSRTEIIEELDEVLETLEDIRRKSYEMKLILDEKGTNIDEGFLKTLKQNEYDIRRISYDMEEQIENIITGLNLL
jgi:hypothetical protein